MEEVSSNMTIAVMMMYLTCHEEIYLVPKPQAVSSMVFLVNCLGSYDRIDHSDNNGELITKDISTAGIPRPILLMIRCSLGASV